jgi:hypothetical protein
MKVGLNKGYFIEKFWADKTLENGTHARIRIL